MYHLKINEHEEFNSNSQASKVKSRCIGYVS